MKCLLLLALAACRFDFDPLVDAGVVENAACGETSCVVDCRTWASCEVDCADRYACFVQCPASGCTVTGCTWPSCEVLCGPDAVDATYLATSATCP